jgi:hypothetical protein
MKRLSLKAKRKQIVEAILAKADKDSYGCMANFNEGLMDVAKPLCIKAMADGYTLSRSSYYPLDNACHSVLAEAYYIWVDQWRKRNSIA